MENPRFLWKSSASNLLMLRFRANPEKIVNVMAFFAEQCSACTKMKIFKLMYFADKEHLLRYGRPITGDYYVRMEWGPTPSSSYDMTKGNAPSRQMVLFNSILSITGNSIKNRHRANMKVFSRSDELILRETAEKLGRMTAAQLSNLSHREATWKKTPENSIMDFELMFEGREDAILTLELLKQESSPAHHAAKNS